MHLQPGGDELGWRRYVLRRRALKIVGSLFEHPEHLRSDKDFIICLGGYPGSAWSHRQIWAGHHAAPD
jgi:hypothetical protein